MRQWSKAYIADTSTMAKQKEFKPSLTNCVCVCVLFYFFSKYEAQRSCREYKCYDYHKKNQCAHSQTKQKTSPHPTIRSPHHTINGLSNLISSSFRNSVNLPKITILYFNPYQITLKFCYLQQLNNGLFFVAVRYVSKQTQKVCKIIAFKSTH